VNKNVKFNNKTIVIGRDNHNTLGVIRSLGEKDVPVYAIIIDEADNSFVKHSKYIKKYWIIKESKDDILEILTKKINNTNEYMIIIPTSDFVVKVIDKNLDLLKKKYILPNISMKNGNISYFMNKYQMNKIASEVGLHPPTSFLIDLKNEININNIDKLTYPCIIKPLENEKGIIKKIKNKNELLNYLYILKKNNNEVMVQEYIHGKNSFMIEMIGFVTTKGEILIPGIIKKIREYPIEAGSTSFGYFSRNNFKLDFSKIYSFIKIIGYNGIFDLEFKYLDDKPFFIEINFRIGAPHYAYNKSGVNIPFLYYLDVIGVDISNLNKNVKIGHKCIIEHSDLCNVKDKNISLSCWIKSILDANSYAIYNKNDIMPFVYYIKNYIKKLTFATFRHVRFN
jgi:D-aspartate ligase